MLFLLFISTIALFAQSPNLSSGYNHTIYGCGNGSIYAWGNNVFKQLDRSRIQTDYFEPGLVLFTDSLKKFDSGKGNHNLGLRYDGTVISWGMNVYGQLGSGESCDSISAYNCTHGNSVVNVLGGETGTLFLENVVDISAGLWQSFAVLASGEVVGWGANEYGQLGSGTYANALTPVYVVKQDGTRLTNIVKVTAGYVHAYALAKDGKVWSWGINDKYQLGSNYNVSRNYASQVQKDKNVKLDGITAIATGKDHGLFLTNTGQVYGVGAYKGSNIVANKATYALNFYAKLVEGGETDSIYLEHVVAIAAGDVHSAVIVDKNGIRTMLTWGDNWFPNANEPQLSGLLAQGEISDLQLQNPGYVINTNGHVINNVLQIALGSATTFAEVFTPNSSSISLFASGSNKYGQLGLGEDINSVQKMTIVGVPHCTSFCPIFSLPADTKLCTPYEYEINTKLTASCLFRWKKNNELLNETSPSITINSGGTYEVVVVDKQGYCPVVHDKIVITDTASGYVPVRHAFCGDSIAFSVFGTESVFWYDRAENGKLLDIGKACFVHKSEAQTLYPDSLFCLWTQVIGCQTIPVKVAQICSVCTTPQPIVGNTSFCHDEDLKAYISGEYIRWYDTHTMQLLQIGNEFSPTIDIGASISLFVSQSYGFCESKFLPIVLSKEICLPQFTLTGNVWNGTQPYANCRVLIYDVDIPFIPDDTAYTNSRGTFQLVSYSGRKYIVAYANEADVANTWYGNKTSEQAAYILMLDANITGLDITMQHATEIDEVAYSNCLPEAIENSQFETFINNASAISVYTIVGQSVPLKSATSFDNLENGIYIVRYILNQKQCSSLIIKN